MIQRVDKLLERIWCSMVKLNYDASKALAQLPQRQEEFQTADEPLSWDGVDLTTLRPKMKQWAKHYIATGVVAEATRLTGYSESVGARLKKRPDVQAYMAWLFSENSNGKILSPAKVLELFSEKAMGIGEDTMVLQSGDVYTIPIAQKDQLAALKELAKFHGLSKQQIEVKHEYSFNVDIDEAFGMDDDESYIEGDFEEVEESVEETFEGELDFLGGVGK